MPFRPLQEDVATTSGFRPLEDQTAAQAGQQAHAEADILSPGIINAAASTAASALPGGSIPFVHNAVQSAVQPYVQGATEGAQNSFREAGGFGDIMSNIVDTAKFIPQAGANIASQALSGVGQAASGVGGIIAGLGQTAQGFMDGTTQNTAGVQGNNDLNHGVAQVLTSPMAAYSALPGIAKGPLSYITGLFTGAIDTGVKNAENAFGNAMGKGDLSETETGTALRSQVMDTLGVLAGVYGGNTAAIGMIKAQPMLLNATVGKIPGMGLLTKGNEMLANATIKATELPMQVAGKVGNKIGNAVQDNLGIENSWATPYLERYDPKTTLNALNMGGKAGWYSDGGAQVAKDLAPKTQQHLVSANQNLIENTNTLLNPKQISEYAGSIKSNQVAIFDGMNQALASTPAIRDATVQILSDAATNMTHPGNQNALTNTLKDFTKTVGTDGTYGSLSNMYNKLDSMVKASDPALVGQESFVAQLQGALRKDMSATIKTVSPEAGSMLEGLDSMHTSVQGKLSGLVRDEINAKMMQGMTKSDATLAAAPHEAAAFETLPHDQQIAVQKAAIEKVIGDQSQAGGILDYQGIVDRATQVLKENKPVLHDNTTFGINWIKKQAETMGKNIDAQCADPVSVADKLAENPSADNLRAAIHKGEGKLSAPTLRDLNNVSSNPELIQSLIRQQQLAKENVGKLSTLTPPEMVAGEKLNSIVSDMQARVKELRSQETNLIKEHATKTVDITPAKKEFLSNLQEKYNITADPEGELHFGDSKFSNDAALQTQVNQVWKNFQKDTSTVKQVDIARDRITNDSTAAKTTIGTNVDAAKMIADDAKARLGDTLEIVIPGYRDLNRQMAKILTAADPVTKALKIPKSLDQLDLNDFADIKSGQLLRRISSDVSGNALTTITPLLKLRDEMTKGNSLADLKTMMDNVTQLKQIYGDPQANNFSNSIARGASKAAESVLPRPIKAAVDMSKELMDDPLNPKNNVGDFYEAYLKALLKKSRS